MLQHVQSDIIHTFESLLILLHVIRDVHHADGPTEDGHIPNIVLHTRSGRVSKRKF